MKRVNKMYHLGQHYQSFRCHFPDKNKPGRIAQSEKCLTADSGVTSLLQARSHTFVEIDHEMIPMPILLPSTDSRRDVVSYKGKLSTKY